MAKIHKLSDLYLEEMQDLWSANQQMAKIVTALAEAATDNLLAERLQRSAAGIRQHAELLEGMIEELGGETGADHCKGMEGLVGEARRHVLEAGLEGAVRDVAIIAQYQRMCHYGIAGFGTARAFAEALGKSQQVADLDRVLERIYESDDYMTDLARRSKNLEAA